MAHSKGRHYTEIDNTNMHGKGDDGYHCEQKGSNDAVIKDDGDGYLKSGTGRAPKNSDRDHGY